jgi:hypothetical protein
MSNNGGKGAAAVGAVALAIGGGVAHFSGAFRSTADDVARGPGRLVDDVPTIKPPPVRDPQIPSGGGSELSATDDLARQGESDDVSWDVICFAYANFYDAATGELTVPEEDEFVAAVVEAIAPDGTQLAYRLKAHSLHETLSDPDANLGSVAQELSCL